jgi:hypothetical protein
MMTLPYPGGLDRPAVGLINGSAVLASAIQANCKRASRDYRPLLLSLDLGGSCDISALYRHRPSLFVGPVHPQAQPNTKHSQYDKHRSKTEAKKAVFGFGWHRTDLKFGDLILRTPATILPYLAKGNIGEARIFGRPI